MLEPFRDLGRAVEAAWKHANYTQRALPELAADALQDACLPERLSPHDVLDWAVTTPQRGVSERSFGDASLIVYDNPRFYIEVLGWHEGSTAIHDHGFAGAFQVFQGSSVHAAYDFTPDTHVDGLHLGELSLSHAEHLSQGSIRPIASGRAFIHALFHLEDPTYSVIVRSRLDLSVQPQLRYLPPSIAYDSVAAHRPERAKTLQAVAFADHFDPDASFQLALSCLRTADLSTTFDLLNRLSRTWGLQHPPRYSDLLDTARQRHGEPIDRFHQAFQAEIRTIDLLGRRRQSRDPDLRYFMALLLTVPERSTLLHLAQRSDPSSPPHATVLRWSQQLSQRGFFGSPIPDTAWNALSLHLQGQPTPFDWPDTPKRILSPLLA